MAAPGEIDVRQVGAVVPDLLVDLRLEARAIGSGLRAEDAAAGATLSRLFGNALRDQRGGFSAMAGCGGVVLFRLVQRHDGAGGAVDQVDLFREGVPEEAGDAEGHVDARTAQFRDLHDLETDDAARNQVPARTDAPQGQPLRDETG